ncbi:MAG: hypothetical protein U0S12_00390 [Fimbriimonadales bacterium]
MKRLDRLIVGELAGPWVFGVGIFTVLIMAGTYLFKITDYIVQGISPATVLQLSVVLLPAIMVKTFAMAMLPRCFRSAASAAIARLSPCGRRAPVWAESWCRLAFSVLLSRWWPSS